MSSRRIAGQHCSRFSTGRLGVALFFVFSGYGISDLWQRETGKHRYLVFAANRVLKIWPLYRIAVLITFLIFARAFDIPTVTIFGVASAEGVRQLGVEWSLDIEAQFYVVAPLLFAARIGTWVLQLAGIGWLILATTGITSLLIYLLDFYAGILIYRCRDQPLLVSPLVSLTSFLIFTAVLSLHPVTAAIVMPTGKVEGADNLADLLAMLACSGGSSVREASRTRPDPPDGAPRLCITFRAL